MRRFGPLLLLLATLPLTAAQDPPAQDQDGPQVASTSDMDVVLGLYKIAHGGKERFEGLRTMAFEYTPSVYDEEGTEHKQASWQVSLLFRPDLDEQEQRTVRLESAYALTEDSDPIRTVSLVTGDGVRVWIENTEGELVPSEARELKATAAFHASSLLNHMDMLYWPDSRDIRCRFGGVLKRDGKDYATLEAEFSPSREVPEPARLYFSGVTSLIERIDAFDPKLHMRIGTVHVEGYEDHDGLKFPGQLRQVDRRGRPVGTWYLEDVELNGEYEREHWMKP